MEQETTRQVKNAPNPTGKGGFGEHPENINPGGEPKNSLKNYVAKKLADMSDEDKEKWLRENKIGGEFQWKMGEGNLIYSGIGESPLLAFFIFFCIFFTILLASPHVNMTNSFFSSIVIRTFSNT